LFAGASRHGESDLAIGGLRLQEKVRSTIQKRDAKGVVRHGAEWLVLWADPNSVKTRSELEEESAARREAAKTEHRLAAAARSLSGDPAMQISFGSLSDRDGRFDGSLDAEGEGAALRGRVDTLALVRRFHDPATHERLAPSDRSERVLFDLCEEVRCEALGALRFPGVVNHLAACQRERLRKADLLNAHLASLIPMAEGLRMVLRDHLLSLPEPSIAASGFWMWDRWIRAHYSSHLMALLSETANQAYYASLTRDLIGELLAELGSSDGKARRFQPTERTGTDDAAGQAAESLVEDAAGAIFRPGGWLEMDVDAAVQVSRQDPVAKPPPYAVFTTAHDLVLPSSDLADAANLRKERVLLDKRRAEFRRDLGRLVLRLQRRLLARQMRNWSFDLDDGLVDASRLDRVIVNPGFGSIYKQEEETEFRDTVVSILIDNSGSMRGKPIELACMAADLISAALERCAVSCEILGFTTRGWSGGQSARDWAAAGRPLNPGRLNDTLHIVYKAADQPVRRSRLTVCGMLNGSILKENIDGEALLWASRRLLARQETRKVLIVISDGAPADQATLEENEDKSILDRNLRDVILEIENSGCIELAALGVKHDVSGYYRNHVYTENLDQIGDSLVRIIENFLI
jgi:cobaltochelatase CobT